MSCKILCSKVNHERWLVSYADFITLLFAFFVVLYAFARADQKKQAQVSAAIDSAFRSLSIASALDKNHAKTVSLRSAAPAHPTTELISSRRVRVDLEHIRQDLQRRLSAQVAHSTISIELGRDGL